MGSDGIFLLMVLYSTVIIGKSKTRTTTFVFTAVASNATTVLLGCVLNYSAENCFWTGPNSQVYRSRDPPKSDDHHRVKHREGDCLCHLALTRIEPKDDGLWNCTTEGDTIPSSTWRLIVQVRPNPPLITFANGSKLPEDVVVSPGIFIDLACISSSADSAQDSMVWFINGNPVSLPSSFTTTTTGFEGDISMSSNLTVAFTDFEGKSRRSLTNISCVVTHATGKIMSTKIFDVTHKDAKSHGSNVTSSIRLFICLAIAAILTLTSHQKLLLCN